MRRSRPLTGSENWELAALLIIIVAVLSAITLIWRLGGLHQMWAVMPPRVAVAMREAQSTLTKPAPAQTVSLAIEKVSTNSTFSAARVEQLTPAVTLQSPIAHHLVIHQQELRRVIHHTDSYWYKGQRYVYWKTLDLRVTSYAPDRQCCWPYSGTTTASGKSVRTNHGHLVAADTRLIPFHCMVRVPGYDRDRPVPVLDRGGAIHGYRLDVLAPTFWSAQHWGVKVLHIKIYRPVARW